jgi:carbon monoxide dehydrogenase subunit G
VKLGGERTFAAPRDAVWRALTRPEALARTVPGVESFEVRDDDHWTAHVKIPLGLVRPRLTVEFELVERREPELARLQAHGRGHGGGLRMETSFELAERGEDETEMRWHADIKLEGPGSSVGERFLRPLVEREVRRVFASLEEQVQV